MTDTASAGLTPEFREEAISWIDESLRGHGMHRTGPLAEPRIRSWAMVIAVPTDRGAVWFKAASHVTAHEIALYPLLVAKAPDIVLHPLAVDTARSWILLPDGGTSLLHSVSGDALVDRMVEIVPKYAELQLALMPHMPALIDMGVPDMRPDVLPGRFDEAFAASEALVRDSESTDDLEALRRIREVRTRYVEWCEILTASPVGPSLDHSDLHANNMLMSHGVAGLPRVYDWGDSVVAHPFSTLLVMLRALMDRLETQADDPRLARVRDAYLEPFTDLAGREELVATADIACWTSVVIRSLTWVKVLELGPPPDPDWVTAPFEWMKTFLNPTYLT